MKKYGLLYAVIFVFLSCTKQPVEKAQKENEEKVAITTGVHGTVSFREGNCMPGIGNRTCKEYPVQRKIRIYAYTLLSQATPSMGPVNGFYDAVSTQLIKEVQSDADGFYEAELPAGRYSLIVVENTKLYAREFEGIPPDLGINPFTITSGPLKKDVVIDYKAAY
ncbi:MAG: hypothetical protein ICV79_25740 [Flavisolibacter sp.]|nr:hypothetical protein [Flavisolibacter sp.]